MWLLFGVNNGGVFGVTGVRYERYDGLCRNRKTCVESSAYSSAPSLVVGVVGSFLVCFGGGGNGGNLPSPIGPGGGRRLRRSNGRSWAGDFSEPPAGAWGTWSCELGAGQPPLLHNSRLRTLSMSPSSMYLVITSRKSAFASVEAFTEVL